MKIINEAIQIALLNNHKSRNEIITPAIIYLLYAVHRDEYYSR